MGEGIAGGGLAFEGVFEAGAVGMLENILLENGRPILIDFGTSALRLQTDTLSEAATNPAGSIRYMAAEQLCGRFSPARRVGSGV